MRKALSLHEHQQVCADIENIKCEEKQHLLLLLFFLQDCNDGLDGGH